MSGIRQGKNLLLALALCVCLSACGGSGAPAPAASGAPEGSASPAPEVSMDLPGKEQPLTLDTENTQADYADFTLVKVSSGNRVESPLGGYYYESDSGKVYVDVVLDAVNTGTAAVSCSEWMTIRAVAPDGTEYTDALYVVESGDGSDLDTWADITPLSAVRFHCAVSVPENAGALKLYLEVNGTEYTCDYTVGETVRSAPTLTVGQTVEKEDFATMVFNGIAYTDDLLPSNTSGSYRHYQVDSASNTYLVVKYDITNLQSSAKDADTFVGIKATYQGKYTYTGFVVVEEEDGAGFSGYEDIAPLTTRHFYYLIEVPKTVTENETELTFFFGGQEYLYRGK